MRNRVRKERNNSCQHRSYKQIASLVHAGMPHGKDDEKLKAQLIKHHESCKSYITKYTTTAHILSRRDERMRMKVLGGEMNILKLAAALNFNVQRNEP